MALPPANSKASPPPPKSAKIITPRSTAKPVSHKNKIIIRFKVYLLGKNKKGHKKKTKKM
jgi:hypothetical protein